MCECLHRMYTSILYKATFPFAHFPFDMSHQKCVNMVYYFSGCMIFEVHISLDKQQNAHKNPFDAFFIVRESIDALN